MKISRMLVSVILTLVLVQPSLGQEETEWWKKTSPKRSKYYNVKTDLAQDDARAIVRHMDATFEIYMELFAKLPLRATRPKSLDLYLFANQNDYNETLIARFMSNGTGSWGQCISSRGKYYLVGWKGNRSADEMKPLLQHEGFHQVAGHLFPEMPVWANEGMAEVFGKGIILEGRLALGNIPPLYFSRLANAIKTKRVHSLEHLFNIDSATWNSDVVAGNASSNYLQSWSVVHFLLYANRGKYRKPFLNFLVNLNKIKTKGLTQEEKNEAWKKSFVNAFGTPNFQVMEQKWLDFNKRAVPTDYPETIRRMDFLAAGMVALRKDNIYPVTIDQLQAELVKRDFGHESNRFGEETVLSASSLKSFHPPYAKKTGCERAFVLVDSRNRLPKELSTERKNPPPLNIVTIGLYPRRFRVMFKKRGSTYQHTILSEAAPQRPRLTVESVAIHMDQLMNPDPKPIAQRKSAAEKPAERTVEKMRVWTSAKGEHQISARLIKVVGKVAHLKKENGKLIEVPYAALSKKDQEHLDRWEATPSSN